MEDERNLLLGQMRAFGTLERWCRRQLLVQHLGKVQNDMFGLLALVLELGLAVLAGDGGEGDGLDGHGLPPTLFHLLEQYGGLDAELVRIVTQYYFVTDAVVDSEGPRI